MENYELKINAQHAGIIMQALDLFQRIGMGQLSEIVTHCRMTKINMDEKLDYKDCEIARDITEILKKLLFNLDGGSYHSISSESISDVYRQAYDIQQVIRHQRWKDEDGKDMSVDSYPPRRYSLENEMPIIKKETMNG